MHSNRKILVVDDNPEILEMIALMLERNHYTVVTINKITTSEFVAETASIQPSLVLMDKSLGWADGCDLCALIKTDRSLQQIPVIMFSAYHKMKEECLFSGADAFLPKPFAMDELLEIIKRLTTSSQPAGK